MCTRHIVSHTQLWIYTFVLKHGTITVLQIAVTEKVVTCRCMLCTVHSPSLSSHPSKSYPLLLHVLHNSSGRRLSSTRKHLTLSIFWEEEVVINQETSQTHHHLFSFIKLQNTNATSLCVCPFNYSLGYWVSSVTIKLFVLLKTVHAWSYLQQKGALISLEYLESFQKSNQFHFAVY